MLERVCRTPAKLLQAGNVVDGKTGYTPTAVAVALIAATQADLDYFGAINSNLVILLAPPIVPKLPCRVQVGNATYDIGAIRVCRDLDGNLAGCRLAVK